MGADWQLVRCECGRSLGVKSGGKPRCSRCNSTKFTRISEFQDSKSLSEAVAMSNLPPEIREEVSSRINSKARKSQNQQSNFASQKSRVMNAMERSTDSDGILRIKSLEVELFKLGIDGTTPEYLIGQAEIEGILMRHDENSWTWL